MVRSRRATRGRRQGPPSLIKGRACPSLKKACPPPCRGGGKMSTLFCNLAIYKFLGKGKGVYSVFLDILTKVLKLMMILL